jgi:hypothetical protein
VGGLVGFTDQLEHIDGNKSRDEIVEREVHVA